MPDESRPRIVFMGTPELSRRLLASIADDRRWEVVGAFAQPDRPGGRGMHPQPPPVKSEAMARGIPVFQPERLRHTDALAQFAALKPDLAVVAAFGQILTPAALATPRLGCVNVHFSLLPRWRGAAPIAWALLAGDAETGVGLMQMDAGLDTGPILAEARIPITPDETAATLQERLVVLAADLTLKTLPAILAGGLPPRPQPAEGATYARKISKEDGLLDWRQPSIVLARRLRALTPWPGAFTFVPGTPASKLLKVHAADAITDRPAGAAPGDVWSAPGTPLAVACAEGSLALREVQIEGGRRITAAQFIAGHSLARLELPPPPPPP
jgi:methionyl-tRNA formyltransferase